MSDLYQFTYKAVARRDDPYFYTNWDPAREYDVVAENKAEALQKLWDLLGPAPRHREWTAKLMRVKDMRVVEAEAKS